MCLISNVIDLLPHKSTGPRSLLGKHMGLQIEDDIKTQLGRTVLQVQYGAKSRDRKQRLPWLLVHPVPQGMGK